MDGNSPCVLIIFAREPVPGETKTRLIPAVGAKGAAALARAFTLDALQKASALKPRQLVIAADAPDGVRRSAYFKRLGRRFGAELMDQGAGNLGNRMARVLEHYSGSGALLMGTDTPSLPVAALARSVELLKRSPLVLGPSLDGGYYLAGVRGPVPDMFRAITWGSKRVLAQTVARLKRRQIRYALGPWWYDVDRPGDLALLVVHLYRVLSAPAGYGAASDVRGSKRNSRKAPLNPCPATSLLLTRMGLLRF